MACLSNQLRHTHQARDSGFKREKEVTGFGFWEVSMEKLYKHKYLRGEEDTLGVRVKQLRHTNDYV